MKELVPLIKQVYIEERIMLILMIANLLFAFALFIFSIVNLDPTAVGVKTSYGDIGGYYTGSWADFLAFPLLAIVFGVMHNFIALRIFKKRGSGMTKLFLLVTTGLIAGAFLVLLRLLEKV